ncbi:hypothetical protein COCSADRAFT_160373 [Bipolaris sorokiniana ND90Pr]|nr:uncharacterized protein COCSADRAFT_160373 [Bipolaris sorokiniana ND90Pr]EMD64127.1 hypothetical protein COCSADRAFT_160373 [Bipolaris sorokiniana ND90Pr]
MVDCPICSHAVHDARINQHIDSGCKDFIIDPTSSTQGPSKAHNFFTHAIRSTPTPATTTTTTTTICSTSASTPTTAAAAAAAQRLQRPPTPPLRTKRSFTQSVDRLHPDGDAQSPSSAPKRARKLKALEDAMPLAERMRPTSLDHVYGQQLVAPGGVLRAMVDEGRLPSMVLWGRPGTGKTTIARLIATSSGARFVEINSTSTKLEQVRSIFAEAFSDLQLTGRKTIVFCDELHRFSRTQQDAFLGPVESGTITLIAATTENPSFKIISALLSRCRTFTLDDLADDHLLHILERAMAAEQCTLPLLDTPMLQSFASFSDGDARTALNLLDLAMSLAKQPDMTKEKIQQSLTKTLVYDRAGDQHYDSISALHKSIRGSDADAALYYLARMLESGEDPRYIARRLIVVASEDVGLADNTMLSLATATYSACEKIGMPECRINLAHAVTALSLAPKSTRVYRAMNNAMDALKEPGVAALPIPHHIRNAPTRLMKDLGYGEGYKYNPHYLDGKVKQDYLPEALRGRSFLEDADLGTKVDPDLIDDDELIPEID